MNHRLREAVKKNGGVRFDQSVMENDSRLIELFDRDQQRRGLTRTTIYERRVKLRCFLEANPKGWAAVTRDDVEETLDRRKLSARSRYCWLSAIHCFYEWAIEMGYLNDDPTARIVRPKMRKTLPRPMPSDDLKRAVAEAPPTIKCWLLLGAYQGLRCQEMAGLNAEDVLESEGLLRVVAGKGDRERLLPLHPAVLTALQALPLPPSGPLFRRRRMKDRYPPNQLSQELNVYLAGLGIDHSAHSLRHWFGTHFYITTRDLRLTQEMLGHYSPETTAIYTAFDRQRAAGAIEELAV